MAMTSAEKAQAHRRRPEQVRRIEARFRVASKTPTTKILLNLENDIAEWLEQNAKALGMSERSKTTQINALLRAAIRRSSGVVDLANEIMKQPNISNGERQRVMAVASAILMLGGTRKDMANAYTEFFEKIAEVAESRDEKKVYSYDVDVNELKSIMHLLKA